MPHVMVPVPAEHEEALMQYVLGLTVRAKMTSWPDGALESFIAGLDDVERAIVARVNQDALAGRACRQPDLTEAVGLDLDALDQKVQAIAERCFATNAPPLILIGKEDAVGPDGASTEVRTYLIANSTSARVQSSLG